MFCSVFAGEARLMPVIFCCPTSPGIYRFGPSGAAILEADIVCETDASPADRWIVRPTMGLLV